VIPEGSSTTINGRLGSRKFSDPARGALMTARKRGGVPLLADPGA